MIHLYSFPGRTFTGELSTFTHGYNLEEDGGVSSNTIGSSRLPLNMTIAVDSVRTIFFAQTARHRHEVNPFFAHAQSSTPLQSSSPIQSPLRSTEFILSFFSRFSRANGRLTWACLIDMSKTHSLAV